MTVSIKDMMIYAFSNGQEWHSTGKHDRSLTSIIENGGMVYIDGNTYTNKGSDLHDEVDIYVNFIWAGNVNEDDRTASLVVEDRTDTETSLRLPYVDNEIVVIHIEGVVEQIAHIEGINRLREMLFSRIDSPNLTPEEIEYVDAMLLLGDL